MASKQRDTFATVKSEGGLLPADLLVRLVEEDKGLKGLAPTDYHLGKNERLNEAVTRSWTRLRGVWSSFDAERQALTPEDNGTTITRERWLLILLQELGYGRLSPTRSVEIHGKSYPISHSWEKLPIHLVGCNIDLDRRSKGVAGAATSAPHGLIQEYLNRSEDTLWAILSNGLILRLLRDNVSLTRQAYVEFDLEALMRGEAFADFKLLWLVCHQSRFEAERPEQFWIERWSQLSHEEGTRILADLRAGVQDAIEKLGAGFLAHPDNSRLRDTLRTGQLETRGYYRQLLRLVYRLLFMFVAEDRELLPDPSAEAKAQQRYHDHYSTQRLRRLAQRKRGTAHSDLWEAFKVVQRLLVHDDGCPAIALPALGGFLWSSRAMPDVESCSLSNFEFLGALRRLAFTERERILRRVDYRNLGSEELGSVYESLLELHPDLDVASGYFRLVSASGNDRKTSGSYYTPTELVQCMLDTALDPVIEGRVREANQQARGQGEEAVREARAQAILNLKVCDPACGSGHFLIAAAHRLAWHLASARTDENEPSPGDVRTALRDVVSRCLYGVDINEMAVELCKVSLWIEALEPGRPLSFLDNKILCGNSLLGTTPKLLADGIPESAFAVLRGDDKKLTATLKKLNKEERGGQGTLFADFGSDWGAAAAVSKSSTELDNIDDTTVGGIRQKEKAYSQFLTSPEYQHQRMIADAWCAAFLWPKWDGAPTPITHHIFDMLQRTPELVPSNTRETAHDLAQHYAFFHWHLAFPSVFSVSTAPQNEELGWSGGFDVVIGNPPWEQSEVSEVEWFASRVPEIADAPNSATRKRMIEALREADQALYLEFQAEIRRAEGESSFSRVTGKFPLTAVGKLNSYALFAETSCMLLSERGRVGIILPSGIATDHSTRAFFSNLVEKNLLRAFYAFENEDRVFPAVDHRVNFCLLTAGGLATGEPGETNFVWFARRADQIHDPQRRFTLTRRAIELLNPNTRTCPIFRSSRDAKINKDIYERIPVLWREGNPDTNPWHLTFRQGLFNMSSDSSLFKTEAELVTSGGKRDGNLFQLGSRSLMPLYEAKMFHHFDHRFGTYEGQTEAQAAMSKLPESTLEQHADANYCVVPRYWVDQAEVDARLCDRWDRDWLLAFRDICRNTDQRTVIASILPKVGVGHTSPLLLPSCVEPKLLCCLYANLCSLMLDYLARQKIGGTHLTYSYLKQFAILTPENFAERRIWGDTSLTDWVVARVVELQYTSHEMAPFAHDCGFDGPPYVWNQDRRFWLLCELDALFFHLYGVTRDDAAYVLDSFPTVRKYDERDFGHFRTKESILQTYDRMQQAIDTGLPFKSRLDPSPCDPRAAHQTLEEALPS